MNLRWRILDWKSYSLWVTRQKIRRANSEPIAESSSSLTLYCTLWRKGTEHGDHNPSLNCLLPCGPQRSKQPLYTLKSRDGSTCQEPKNSQSKDRHNANYDLELVLHVVSHEEGIKE